VLACAYHAEGNEPLRNANHPWRKPNPGMILAARDCMDIDLSRSWIIGDSVSDIVAGAAAGVAGGVLLGAADGPLRQAQAMANDRFAVVIAPNLAAAVAGLIGDGRLAHRDAPDQ
jgi:D-glycero-D-manno-heptose 1,7-bisphosphate phosphatase